MPRQPAGSSRSIGQLGGDTIEDLHLALPAVRSDTNASTLRTSIGAAASATGYVDLLDGPVTSPGCPAPGTDVGECPRQTNDSIADNDFTSTTGSWVSGIGKTFVAGSLHTPGGTTLTTPAGSMTTRTSTNACGSCGFGDSDGLPWSDASVATTTASTSDFNSDHGVGVLSGSFWTLDNAWTPSASIDHDSTGGGLVTATAQLSAPAVRVLDLVGAPVGYAGAVKVGAFTARATAAAGYTLAAPDVTTGTTAMQIQLWDGAGYQTINLLPGTALDTTATASFTISDHIVSFTSRVQAQPSNFSTLGTAPRGDAAAQHPSILLITVEVTITSATLTDTPPTTTTVPTTSTTTTDPVDDYNRSNDDNDGGVDHIDHRIVDIHHLDTHDDDPCASADHRSLHDHRRLRTSLGARHVAGKGSVIPMTTHAGQHDHGTTLIELMISMLVMAIGMAIIASTLLLAEQATHRIEKTSEAIDAARLLSASLDRELRSAVCITSPGENLYSNTLTFQTLSAEVVSVLTYTVVDGAVTRRENLGEPRTIISEVGTTTTAFKQVTTPLRTVVVDIPIRSENGGQFQLQTTIAGRNAWRSC